MGKKNNVTNPRKRILLIFCNFFDWNLVIVKITSIFVALNLKERL